MATENFYSESWEYYVFYNQDPRDMILDEMMNTFEKLCYIGGSNDIDTSSYPSEKICYIAFHKEYWWKSYETNINIVMRDWYYYWINVDYYIVHYIDWEEVAELFGIYEKEEREREVGVIEKLKYTLATIADARLGRIGVLGDWSAMYYTM